MSEHAPVQSQRVSAPQPAVRETSVLERRERQTPVPDHLMAWDLNADDMSFQPPRTGYNFSRVPALTGLTRRIPSLVHTQDDIIPDSIQHSSDTETALSETSERSASESSAASAETDGQTDPSLLVEDETQTLSAGQMRRSEFLEQLQAQITRTVEAAVKGTGRSAKDCPYINYWFSFYRRQDSRHIERAIFRYAPEASRINSTEGYIAVIVQRARQAAETWAGTGKITGVPSGIPMQLPGMSLVKGVLPGSQRIFFKAKPGGARSTDSPRAVQQQLGAGQPLSSPVRSRMESAFQTDFSHVRAHTGTNAAGLSSRYNARAFTVGSHVAFGSGQYKPGTLMGDALIAHELAHVVQQKNAGEHESDISPMEFNSNATRALEQDADRSAFNAVTTLWGNASDTAGQVVPRLRSGLTLHRCSNSVFSESNAHKFQGYDDSVSPNGLVVPEAGDRIIKLNKSDGMTIGIDDPSIATLTEGEDTLTVSGGSHGSATISAVEGTETVEQLAVSVKRRIDHTVDYHYMSDNAGHATTRSPGDESVFTATLNRIWGQQANIHFTTGTVDQQTVAQDLGDEIIWGGGVGDEWSAVTGFATGGDYNVFLIWEYDNPATNPNAATSGSNTLLEDDDCSDALTIAHEAGHFLGIRYGGSPHPSRSIMSGCGGDDRQRVTKAQADQVNT